MAAKNNPTGPDVGVMIGSDGRLKAVVDFEFLAKLFDSASRTGADGTTVVRAEPYLTSEFSESIEKVLSRLKVVSDDFKSGSFDLSIFADEDAIERAAAESAVNDEALPLDVAKRIINGDNQIKVYREYRSLTQKALADQVGTKPVYISQIETGASNPSTKLLRKLAGALGVTIDDLVD